MGVAVPLVALVAVIAGGAWLAFLKFDDFRTANAALVVVSGSRAVQHQVHELQQERGRLALNGAATGRMPNMAEFDRYGERIAELDRRRADADSIGHPVLREHVRALEATGHVKEAMARERGLITGILAAKKVEPWDYGRFSAVRASREDRLAEFDRMADKDQRARLHAALNTSSATDVARFETDVVNGQHVDPAIWWSSITAVVDDLRAAEQALADDITHQARQIKQTALRDLGVLLGLGALATTVEILLFTRHHGARQADSAAALVTEIAATLLDGATVDEACRLVARRMLDLSSASCVLILRGHRRDKVRFCAGAGDEVEDLRRLQNTITSSRVADTLSSEMPVIIDDLSGHLRTKTPSFGPAVAIPIRARSRVLGLLLTVRGAGAAPYRLAEVARLVTITNHAAGALEQQVDVEDERNRIAHALYPLAFRRLISAGMSLQGALSVLPDAWTRRRVEAVINELDETAWQMRIAIFDLESVDTKANLRQRLVDLTVELTKDTDLLLTVCVPRSVERLVPTEVTGHVEALVHQAISDIVSHAHASELTLEVESTGDGLAISLQDNGIGLTAAAVRSKLRRLEQQAAGLGELSVTPLPAGGTRLTWCLPLAESRH